MKRLIAILAFLLIPSTAFAAVTFTDDFESYGSGVNLDGLNGGSGWSAAWVDSSPGDYKTNSSVVQGGSRSIGYTLDASESTASRAISNSTDGTYSLYMYHTSTIADTCEIQMYEGASVMNQIRMKNDGNIYGNNSGVETLIQAYSANTWYKFQIDFDNSTDQYRVSIDGAAYTSWFSYFSSVTNFNKLTFQSQAGGGGSTCYWDTIAPVTAAPAPSTITPLRFYHGTIHIENGNLIVR